jgi:hypothetical protein
MKEQNFHKVENRKFGTHVQNKNISLLWREKGKKK